MASIFSRNRNPRRNSGDTVIHEFLFVEVPIDIVSTEVITWGEAAWWPKSCLWKYRRLTDGDIRVGTQYVIEINKRSAPEWNAEVTQLLPRHLVERTFTKGMFKGFEIINIEERANGTRIDYELHFQIRGPLNLILWPFVLRKQYVNTIKLVLNSMKNHLVNEFQKKQQGGSDAK